MSAGRTNEPRAVTVTTTSASTAITAAGGTFAEEDAGRSIAGAGIPAGATIVSVESDTAATLSAAATAAGTPSVTLGAGASYGFIGWSPETDGESETYSISAGAGASAPSVLTDDHTRTERRARG